MEISAKTVKELREKTGAGMMDCKAALQGANGDFDKAVVILREKGLAAASKRIGRVTKEGLIDSYIHSNGKIGVIIEVDCETDFVSRNAEFISFVHDIAMQIAAAAPGYVSREEVPVEIIESEKSIFKQQATSEGKPEKIVDKIVEGKIEKFYAENCLLDQAFVKDEDFTISDLLNSLTSKIGERLVIRRFCRFVVGELEK